jgi:ISXO2-like transposase domain
LVETGLPHGSVSHSRSEEVRGNIYTQTIDSLRSFLKRATVGIFHNISAKYLPLHYLAVFEWRHSSRTNQDIFGEAIARW